MKKLVLSALMAIYKKIQGKTLFNGNTYYWGKGHIGMLALVAVMITGCEQFVARKAGGTLTIKLESGQKLIEATWKESNLWYLTEPMDSDYKPKTKVFQESSMYGVLEGKVIFVESKN